MDRNKATPRIGNSLHRRFLQLLDMEYKPSELAEILGVNIKTIYSYTNFGLPARKDKFGHFWINGKVLAEWGRNVLSTHKVLRLVERADFYCLGCKQIVRQEKFSARHQKGSNLNLLRGTCPYCGVKISKYERLGK